MKGGIGIRLDYIGTKVKQLRLRHKKTQQQIADSCGISKSLLSKIENGQTSSAVATLSKISHALEVPLSWLLEDKPEQDLVLLPSNRRDHREIDEHMEYSIELLDNRTPYSGVVPMILTLYTQHL